jgi:protein TonB
MKKYLFAAAVAFISVTAMAQDSTKVVTTAGVQRVVNREPRFKKGGRQGFVNYIKEALGPAAYINNNDGVAIVTFLVQKDGTITDVKMTQGIEKVLNQSIIRVVKESPKWIPAYKDGKPIATVYTFKISF